jgi:hypothetical protein
MNIVNPLKSKTKLNELISTHSPKSILIIFNHGVGDLVMFMKPFSSLKELYPDILFKLGIAECLTYQTVFKEEILPLKSDKPEENPIMKEFDLIAHIEFPMSEHQFNWTKAEYCCIEELGIPPVHGHLSLPKMQNRLVAVHFQITCLPGSANADEKTAEKIWNDILEAGYIPLETHFQHIFHNPVNAKFKFINASVRKCKAELASLVGLMQNVGYFVGVVSGNFHVALACLPAKRIFLLEKDFKAESFIKFPIARADLKNYKGEVKDWLLKFKS